MRVRPLVVVALLVPCACAPNYIDLGYDHAALGTGGSTTGTGGTGGSMLCVPGEKQACYTGPKGTQGQGICEPGQQACNGDGSAFGACEGEQLPKPEDCATPLDEDCDGLAPSCTGLNQWSNSFGDAGEQHGEGIATDAAGNVAITGRTTGTIDFGGGPLMSPGAGTDVFVAKFDGKGNYLFGKIFGDASSQAAYAIAMDAADNIFLAGSFSGEVDFGGGPLTSTGGGDIFVAKLDASGAHIWSKTLGADPGFPPEYALAVDAAGDLIMAGSFGGKIDLGGGPVAAQGAADIFVAKLDGSGAYKWARTFGGPGQQAAFTIATDASLNIVIAGTFDGPIDFGTGELANLGGEDIFVAKLDASGATLWSERFGDTGSDVVKSAAIDGAGNVILGGWQSAPNVDVFVAKLDSKGGELWSKRFGDAAVQRCYGVSTDPAGSIVLAGSFSGVLDFGNDGKITSAGGTDVFTAKLQANGAHLWSKRFGDDTDQGASSIATDPSGAVFLTGSFSGAMDVGQDVLTSAGGSDVFLMKLAP